MALAGSESLRHMQPAIRLDSTSDPDIDSLLQKVRHLPHIMLLSKIASH